MLIFLLTQYGNTAIHYAAVRNDKTVLDRLLPHLTSTVDIENNDGRTPLWYAANGLDIINCPGGWKILPRTAKFNI